MELTYDLKQCFDDGVCRTFQVTPGLLINHISVCSIALASPGLLKTVTVRSDPSVGGSTQAIRKISHHITDDYRTVEYSAVKAVQ